MKLRITILAFIVVLFTFVRLHIRSTGSDNNKPLVVIYETDLKHPHLKLLQKTLSKHGYEYKVLTDKRWVGFGKKVRRIHQYLKTLDANKVVIVCDARDVLSVNYSADEFMRKFIDTVDYDSKVVVSTEIGCCVRTAFEPGQYRTNTGDVLHRSYEINEKGESGQEKKWKNMFKWRAAHRGVKHAIEQKQSIYLNAGVYAGKCKNITQVYAHMAIDDKEDDQIIMSEIFYLHPNMFHLDYSRTFFSNSHVWDKNNASKAIEDTGCYYDKIDGKVVDTYVKSTPFFVHTPGKHFKCYDHVKGLGGLGKTSEY